MTVVIAIIIVLVGLVVPAASQMWRERKIAEAQNSITGMLMTARARAIQSGGVHTGLFFFIDSQGVQRIVPITQNPNDPAESDPTKLIQGWESDPRWYNVFTVVRNRSFTLPPPMRVTPLSAICTEDDSTKEGMCKGKAEHQRFSDAELKTDAFDSIAIGTGRDTAQVDRNFFTLIFAPDGELLVGRDVLIRDIDDEAALTGDPDEDKPGFGVITGKKVDAPKAGVEEFFQNAPSSPKATILPPGALPAAQVPPPKWLVVDSEKVAINFPSVDGLLVYDDSLFNEAGDVLVDDLHPKRRFLREYGLPFYINRLTGAVIRGQLEVAQATGP